MEKYGRCQIISIVVIFIFISQSHSWVSYDGYSLLRITPTTEAQLQYLLTLNANTSSGLDYWLRSTAVNHSADVVVAPFAKESLLRNLNDSQIPYKTLIPDLGRVIEEDRKMNVTVPPGLEFFANYNSIDDVNNFVKSLAAYYPSHVSLLEIGSTFEGKPLLLFRISSNPSPLKPAVWIQGGAHAREQIGPYVVLYTALKLSILYKECEMVTQLIDSFDWYLLPVLNPDGYEYCRTKDRLWRKTRSFNKVNPNCVGVDANRNWDFKWSDTAGASTNPCSHNYAGSRPFSEPETRAVSKFVLDNLRGRLHLFLDFHSYSQRWLTPWGYTSKLPPDYEDQKLLAEVATTALGKVCGTTYSIGSSGNIMYTVTGGARDWMYGTVGVKYSYVVEVRDKGDFGFLLPRNQILPTVNETWVGIRAMGLELVRLLQYNEYYYEYA